MPATSREIDQRIWCECGEGFWRYPLLTEGLAATKRKCPSCKCQKWVVVRDNEVVGVTDVLGLDTGSFQDAMKRVEALSALERRVLSEAALEYAEE